MKIEKYAFGELCVDGITYRSDVIIYPERVDSSWWRKEGHKLQPADLQAVLAAAPEVLIVGTGYSGCMQVLPETQKFLKRAGIELVTAPTELACQRFNALRSSKRRVIAALHLTC